MQSQKSVVLFFLLLSNVLLRTMEDDYSKQEPSLKYVVVGNTKVPYKKQHFALNLHNEEFNSDKKLTLSREYFGYVSGSFNRWNAYTAKRNNFIDSDQPRNVLLKKLPYDMPHCTASYGFNCDESLFYASSYSREGKIYAWHTGTEKFAGVLEDAFSHQPHDWINSMDYHPFDPNALISYGKTVRAWDVEQKKVSHFVDIFTFKTGEGTVLYHPTATSALINVEREGVGNNAAGFTYLWDLQRAAKANLIFETPKNDYFAQIACSPDGLFFAKAHGNDIYTIDLRTNKVFIKKQIQPLKICAHWTTLFFPNNTELIAADTSNLYRLNIDTLDFFSTGFKTNIGTYWHKWTNELSTTDYKEATIIYDYSVFNEANAEQNQQKPRPSQLSCNESLQDALILDSLLRKAAGSPIILTILWKKISDYDRKNQGVLNFNTILSDTLLDYVTLVCAKLQKKLCASSKKLNKTIRSQIIANHVALMENISRYFEKNKNIPLKDHKNIRPWCNKETITAFLLDNIHDAECPICLENYSNVIQKGNAGIRLTSDCNHNLCSICVSRINTGRCPLCRQQLWFT